MFKRFGWVFLVTLIVGPLAGLFVGGVIAYISPKMYDSTATLQVRPAAPPVNVASSDTASLIPTKLEVIRSQATLDEVIDRLDLITRWGLPRHQVMPRLLQAINATQIKNTDLIEIQVRTSNPEDSKAIAEAVADTYRAHKKEVEGKRYDQALRELREAVRAQEDVVEEKRKVLTQLIRNEGMIYSRGTGANSGYTQQRQALSAAQKYADLETEKIKLESQIDALLRYDGEQLLTYAAGVNLPENIVKSLHPRWLEAKRRLDAAKEDGLAENHPTVIRQRKIIESLDRDLEEGVVALRETLRAQLELVKEQTERLRIKVDEERDARNRGVARHSFDDAKAEFETAQDLLEKLKVKLISEEMGKRISEDPVAIHAEPVEALTPSSPNIALHLLLGAAGGLLLGLIAPLVIIPLVHRMTTPGTG